MPPNDSIVSRKRLASLLSFRGVGETDGLAATAMIGFGWGTLTDLATLSVMAPCAG
ncbi:hypothetical protein BREVUG8_110194 [Brevundimonas sp. G8]|nr:hypothetical protein BREVUG8_110194 [Brevundimonas sp. G8]